MLRIFKTLLAARPQHLPASVHLHVDDDGAEYACHDWECQLRTQRPRLARLVGPIA